MYADRVTDSMKAAISETDRRRAIQVAYNEKHDITPTTIRKAVAAAGNLLAIEDRAPAKRRRSRDGDDFSGPEELEKMIVTMEEEMNAAAEDLRFEQAARIRDELRELKRDLEGMQAGA
jgi:excinuclease ABC subunit B